MHEGLQKEIAVYEKRTPKSAEAHLRALKRIPLGVASNYRAYDPYPIFVKEGQGSKIRDLDDEGIRRQAIGLDDYRARFFFRLIQQRAQLFERDFLISKINRGRGAASDADDLRIDLRTEGEARERHRHRNPRLQDKVRAEQQKEDQQKGDVEERNRREPAEMMFFRPGKLHALRPAGR